MHVQSFYFIGIVAKIIGPQGVIISGAKNNRKFYYKLSINATPIKSLIPFQIMTAIGEAVRIALIINKDFFLISVISFLQL